MSKRSLAFVLGLVASMLLIGAATATAAAPPPGVQTADQSATSAQGATAASGATQIQPSNTNISVRVLSPGNDGSVSQTNSASSNADASNSNSAKQNADQSQGGAGGIQTSNQSAANGQLAGALSLASQFGASNTNTPVRVGSTGDNGSVTQSNDVSSNATSTNENSAKQDADQSQAGSCGCKSDSKTPAPVTYAPSDPAQAAQAAPAEATKAVPTSTTGQSNSADSGAESSNGNGADQSSAQSQSGSPGTGVQTSDQSATNTQKAVAASEAKQIKPKNVNISVRVLSPGDDGNVTQSNSVSSDASASNENATHQDSDQHAAGSGSCKCDGQTGVQTGTQSASNDQAAFTASAATQYGAKNTNIPVRVLSPGNNGSVDQSNSVSSTADSTNRNRTHQDADQNQGGGKDCGCDKHDSTSQPLDRSTGDGKDCGCAKDGPAIQTSGQSADSKQIAGAISLAKQDGASNSNTPVRVGSKGDDGSVKQSNDASSEAEATNRNRTKQDADQDIHGGSGPTTVQTSNQWAGNEQLAGAASAVWQSGASNRNAPVRVGSPGGGGKVDQSNSASSEAESTNRNKTHQDVDQDPSAKHDDCGCGSTGIQTADQKAGNAQAALAKSVAVQDFGRSKCGCDSGGNSNEPVRVGSWGDDGSVKQSNDASSEAEATNRNRTKQDADQDLSGSGSTGIQTANQWAGNEQLAASASGVGQFGASNSNAPVRVGSPGGGGSVDQSNSASSEAESTNRNKTHQDADQHLSDRGKCGCDGSTGIQVAEQKAENAQAAAAFSGTLQLGAKNDNSPLRVGSPGDGGKVEQSNSASSEAESTNRNKTHQDADQDLSGSSKCGCGDGIGIQALGQKSENDQKSLAGSFTVQDFGHSKCGCHEAGNSNDPVRVWSYGADGSVKQSNTADSEATADNSNRTHQDGDQSLNGGDGIGIQALGQLSTNAQLAAAFSATLQHGASNENGPIRVYSKGDAGKVEQSNDAQSEADSDNHNRTHQDGSQGQRSGCGCDSSPLIQALGQAAYNRQLGLALSKTFQLEPRNANDGADVGSSKKRSEPKKHSYGDGSDAGAPNGDRAEMLTPYRES